MNRYRLSFSGLIPYITLTLVAAFLFAIVEYFAYALLDPGPYIGWTFYLGSGFPSWGIHGPGHLLAHKFLAYAWIVAVFWALGALITWPVTALLRAGDISRRRSAFAFAIGAIGIYHLAFIANVLIMRGFIRPPVIMLAPLLGIIIIGAVYGLTGTKLVKSVSTSRPIWALCGAGLIIAAVWSYWPGRPTRAVPRGPNVLIITIDTLRADKVGPHDGVSLTPHIDRWGEGATRFDRCVAPSNWTMPSLASLHTGLYAPVHDSHRRLPLGSQFTTLAEYYRDAGYDTACVAANMVCEPRFGLLQGFNYCRTMEMVDGSIGSRFYYTVISWPFLQADPRKHPPVGTTPTVERRAVRYLTGRTKGERPFFMWVHFLDPHEPYDPPRAYVSTEVFARRLLYNHGDIDGVEGAGRLEVEELYEGEVRYVDAAAGHILATLEKQGLAENTIVIISADHGEELWEHGMRGHGHQFYDETVLVPLLIKAPGLYPPGRVTKQVRLIDLFGTLFGLLGTPPRSPYQAEAISVADGDPASGDNLAFSSNPFDGDPSRVIVTNGEKKFIVYLDDGKHEYFDLTKDPGELRGDTRIPLDLASRNGLERWRKENQRFIDFYGIDSRSQVYMDRQLKTLGYVK